MGSSSRKDVSFLRKSQWKRELKLVELGGEGNGVLPSTSRGRKGWLESSLSLMSISDDRSVLFCRVLKYFIHSIISTVFFSFQHD